MKFSKEYFERVVESIPRKIKAALKSEVKIGTELVASLHG